MALEGIGALGSFGKSDVRGRSTSKNSIGYSDELLERIVSKNSASIMRKSSKTVETVVLTGSCHVCS